MLTRNVWLPLSLGAISALLFVGLLYYLLSTLRWVEHSTQVISETRDVAELSADMESSMRGFLNSGAERFLENFHTGSARIAAEIEAVVQLTADNPAQSDRMRTISVLQKQWIGLANELIAGRQRGENVETLVNSSRARPVRMQIRQDLRQFLAEESRLSRERSSTASTAVPIASAVFLIFTLGVSLLLAAFGRGELKRIASAYDLALEEARVREHKANELVWLRDGQRRLAESVVGKLQMEALGRNALEFFASYLGSVVGAFYVRQGDGTLRRTASWGLSAAHSGAQQAFGSGDSLVAEAAAGRRQFQLDDLPEGYIRVTSGLGHAAPRSLLVSPVYNEDSVSGVIELGFLRPIAPRDSELLQLASDALGAAMEAARYRERQQLLVSESQQLNEELQVQQEELRTANEELEEQTRALKESQGHLETQQAELEQTNEHLSQQRDALDERNDALKAAQLELQLRADELQSASRYKSEFLANMSHELRTPLNSSLILAKLLSDNPDANLNAEQVKFAESIYSAGNDLLGLINDILDISKVEAGKLEIRPEITRVASLADALRRTFEPLAGTKKLGFDVTLAPDLPATFFTDRQRVEQILKNLLSNAFKFTELGRVALHIERSGGSGIAFKVQDSGIGIAPEQHQVIFEAFRQADGTTSRRYGGTGLGLSISRNLAGLLGGAIEIFSTPGKGSTFRMELPLQYEISPRAALKHTAPPNTSSPRLPDPPPAPLRALRDAPVLPREPAPRTQPLAPHAAFPDDRSGVLAPQQRRVLVVEDDAEFARILFELAHELGYHCLVASQADEALVLAESMAPDAILLDIRLPDASGLALLQQLKERPRTRHLPVHVISAEDLSEPAMQMGAIGYSIKPTTREQLREVFASVERKLAQKVKR
ncbi:MAG: CHASE3 domain-containing protein, partial [Polaromonas sp.]|nr:CHASE3 domain-containing protein [Polaromonas sp.]